MQNKIIMNSEGINMVRYSDLTTEQLRSEIEKYKKEAQKAEQVGNISEVAINERKVQMLMSYMAYPEDYKPGEVYEIRLDPGYTFKVNYVDGVMAWGHRVNLLKETLEKEEALPISLLGEKIEDHESLCFFMLGYGQVQVCFVIFVLKKSILYMNLKYSYRYQFGQQQQMDSTHHYDILNQ